MYSSFKPNQSPRQPIPLDFQNVRKVPDSHAWNDPATDEDELPVFDEPQVPIIDLTDPRATELIRNACEKWGVFKVTNHGISLDLLDQAENLTMKLFSLPAAARKILAAQSPNGQTGYGIALMSPFFQKLMWFEGFIVSGSPMEHAMKLWPDHLENRTKFCDIIVEYQKKMKALTEKVFGIMASSLGLSLEEKLEWFGDGQHQAKLNMNYYPPCPDPTQAVGLATHTDTPLLTLVYPSTTANSYSGLQVLSEDNLSWVSVEPVRGAILVNLGHLMKVFTNGRFKSVIHRVVVHKSRSRTSRAYFYGPPKDVKVSPAAKMVDDGRSALYIPVSWDDVLHAKAKYFNRALDSFKI